MRLVYLGVGKERARLIAGPNGDFWYEFFQAHDERVGDGALIVRKVRSHLEAMDVRASGISVIKWHGS